MPRRLANRIARPLAGLLLAGTAAVPVWAGETVLYDAAPSWVDVAKVDAKPSNSNAIIMLLDQ